MSSFFSRSFYVTLVGLCAIGALNSCGDKADEQPKQDSLTTHREPPKGDVLMIPSALPNGEMFKIEYTKHGIDSILSMPDASKLSTPEAAAEYNLSLPPKLTVPPHLLPAKDVKVIEQTDSTAMISFAAQYNPSFGRMSLKRVSDGQRTVWLVESVVALHPSN